MVLLASICISREDDGQVWEVSNERVYQVKTPYTLRTQLSLPTSSKLPLEKHVLDNQWKSVSPTKVVSFVWHTLLYTLPFRANLLQRGVITELNTTAYVFCNSHQELERNLFLKFKSLTHLWYMVLSGQVQGFFSLLIYALSSQSFLGMLLHSEQEGPHLNLACSSHSSMWIFQNSLMLKLLGEGCCSLITTHEYKVSFFNVGLSTLSLCNWTWSMSMVV